MTTTTTSLSPSADISSLTSSIRWATDYLSDEDEIVWSLSSSAILSSSPPLNSPLSETADFVLVSRIDTSPATVTTTAAAALNGSTISDTIAKEMAALSLSPTPQPHRRTDLSPVPKPAPAPLKESSSTANKGGGRKATIPPPLIDQQHTQTRPPAVPRTRRRKAAKKAGSSSSSSSSGSQSAANATPSLPVTKSVGSAPVVPKSKKRVQKKNAAAVVGATGTILVTVPAVDAQAASKDPPTAKGAEKSSTGLGLRSVVYDLVTGVDGEGQQPLSSPAINAATTTGTTTTTGYQEAHKYMTSYLAHPPPPGNNGSALLMLQALILELGCLPAATAGKFSIPELPGSLRQAKLLLKSHAFINVRDYLAVREQGQAALRRVMHPNRKSLVKEVRKGKRMAVQEVKDAGLNVLLVNTRF